MTDSHQISLLVSSETGKNPAHAHKPVYIATEWRYPGYLQQRKTVYGTVQRVDQNPGVRDTNRSVIASLNRQRG